MSESPDQAANSQVAPAKPQHPLKRAWGSFVAALLVLLSKAKLLLLGLTKLSTLGSMLAFFAVYWHNWGWQGALGFVLCIYVHEMGHVYTLRKYGIAASAPVFIPFVGALVRLKQHPNSLREDARVGLAGPVWGLVAALICYAMYFVTGAGIWAAIARIAGAVNLFNLIPVWQLDGGRGFRSLSRLQRLIAVGVVGGAFWITRYPLLVLIGIGGVYRVISAKDAPPEHDWETLITYSGLIAALTWLALIYVPR